MKFGSLVEALRSKEAVRLRPDLGNQAAYYLECVLARLHGVQFGPHDRIVDAAFEESPEFRRVSGPVTEVEVRRTGDREYGRLDRFR
jgi:hypothetical protein